MKWFKRIVFLFLTVFGLSVVSIAIIGTQYKDAVVDFVKNELGKKLNREVRVGKIQYSLFSSFPNVSVDLLKLETYSFQPGDIPFLKLNKVHLVFDIIPLIKGEFKLGQIILEEGQINIIHNRNESPNFNLLKDSPDSNSTKSSISINLLQLKDIELTYQNWRNNELYALTFEECSAVPNSFLDSINLNFTGQIPSVQIGEFKSEVPIDLRGDFNLGLVNDSLRFYYKGEFGSGNAIFKGGISFYEKKEKWNIQCDILNHNISDILAIIPDQFKDDNLKSLKGDLNAKFKIKGNRTSHKFPSLEVYFNFSGGLLKIVNKQLKEIAIEGSYFQPDITSIYGAKAKVDKCSINYGGIILKGRGTIKEFSRPLISAKVQSSFNLKNLLGLVLDEEFNFLDGEAVLDLDFSGKIFDVFSNINKELKKFQSKGSITFSDVVAQPSDFDYPLSIESGKLNFSNQDLVFDSFKGKILSSTFGMNGRIKNYLETLFKNQPLAFDADLKIDKVVLEDFILQRSDSSNIQDVDYQFDLPKSITLKTNLKLGEFSFRDFNSQNIKGEMLLENQQLSFKELSMVTCDGTASLDGYINTLNPSKVVYKCTSNFKNIDAEKAFTQFENFGQDVLLHKHVKGRISLSTLLLAESDKQLNIYEEKIYTETDLNIVKGELISFEPLIELQNFLNEEFKLNFNLSHLKFETLKNNIKIKDGVITIPEMAIRSSDINLDIAGKHTFNQEIDYLLKINHNEIFKANKQNKIDEEFGVVENNDKTATLPLRMKGDMDDPKFTYDTKTKMNLITDSWKREGKVIKKVFADEFGGLFKSKKNKTSPSNDDGGQLNNTSSKTQTIVIWDEEDEEDEENE